MIVTDCRPYHRLAGSMSSRMGLPVDSLGYRDATILLELEPSGLPGGTDTRDRQLRPFPPWYRLDAFYNSVIVITCEAASTLLAA